MLIALSWLVKETDIIGVKIKLTVESSRDSDNPLEQENNHVAEEAALEQQPPRFPKIDFINKNLLKIAPTIDEQTKRRFSNPLATSHETLKLECKPLKWIHIKIKIDVKISSKIINRYRYSKGIKSITYESYCVMLKTNFVVGEEVSTWKGNAGNPWS